MNSRMHTIIESIQRMLLKYESLLQQNTNVPSWIPQAYENMKKEFSHTQIPDTSFHTRRKRQGELQKGFQDFVFNMQSAYGVAHQCHHREIPAWMKKNPEQELISFLQLFFQNISSIDEKTLAINALTAKKGIFDYKKDFEEYQANKAQKILSREEYKKLCNIYKMLQAMSGFLQK